MSEATRGAGTLTDDFVDLVCADPSLLRAEFDALVAASWDSEPPTPPTGTRTLVGVIDPDRRPRRSQSAIEAAYQPRRLRIDAAAHQRSPPQRACAATP
jgi:hypothetical protein